MTSQIEEAMDTLGVPEATRETTGGEAFALESRGWTLRADTCIPKSAALASLANLAPPEPVASVGYVSHGNVLVVGGDDAAVCLAAAKSLAAALHVTVLLQKPEGSAGDLTVWTGKITALHGHLGEFVATIDSLCVPGQPIRSGAQAKFDLVLDFRAHALFEMHQPPQGYFRASADAAVLGQQLAELREAVGDFDKPRYFAYRESICAHSRSSITGCTACIDVCSTRAISPKGDHVEVDPHLCMGCGACSTVCPSGAMSFQFPRVADRGAQMKQLLATYRHAGGESACILFHNGSDGRDLLAATAVSGSGIPSRVIPLEAWHVASIGLDLLLAAVAFGANQVAVLCAGSEAPDYLRALRAQMALGQAILTSLGYTGTHFVLVETNDAARAAASLEALAPAMPVGKPASFLLSNDKRTAIEFAVEHLLKHAPTPRDEIALPAGAPFGQVLVDTRKCTLCLACAGACPASALMDGGEQPMLKFLERNCVQCGLCEQTCPEDAITLSPRLLLAPGVRESRVLNETRPFHCVSCNKAFGTEQMVTTMLGRLAGHSMFADAAAQRRLRMCADCRVVDMMSNKNEASILNL